MTDSDGNFKFSNLPGGDYYVNAYVQYEQDLHPMKSRTTMGIGADGDMIYGTERHEGLKINPDDVVVYASANVDSAHGYPGDHITSFSVAGELLCCTGSI